MVSDLPPRLRDTTDIQDRVRQDRANLSQLYVGFNGGRFPPSRRVGSDASQGVFDNSDDEDEGEDQTPEWEANDWHLCTAAGGQVPVLSHEPLDESLQVFWHPRGIGYGPIRWTAEKFTVNGTSVTIPDPDQIIEANDAFSFHYQYLTGEEEAGPINWGSVGPYLIVPEGDTTNYSGIDVDDSSWPIAAAPVGHYAGVNPGAPTWPPVVTDSGTTDVGIWLRRTMYCDVGLIVRLRSDGDWKVYVDGVLLGSGGTVLPFYGGPDSYGPFTVAVGPGDHVIALHMNDEGSDPPGADWIYADLNVAEISS